LALYLLAALGLAGVAWKAISGRIYSIDGPWPSLISLALAAAFGGNLAWPFYTGEVQPM
jgi:hypothetical protein